MTRKARTLFLLRLWTVRLLLLPLSPIYLAAWLWRRRKKAEPTLTRVVVPVMTATEPVEAKVDVSVAPSAFCDDPQPVGHKWCGKPIEKLDDKHLYNIVMAIGRGKWANGNKVRVKGDLSAALQAEFAKRALAHERIRDIELANMRYRANETQAQRRQAYAKLKRMKAKRKRTFEGRA